MVASTALTTRIEELAALFNRRSLDLPDRLFDRHTQFLLNGTPFEAMLGRSPADPLVLMIARGPAGYRFVIKALQHAIPDGRIDLGAIESGSDTDGCVVPFWLSGHLRGAGEPVHAVVRVAVSATAAGLVTRADALADPALLAAIREARLRD